MVIPLDPSMYRLVCVGEATETRYYNTGWGASMIDDRLNLVSYELNDWARTIVEAPAPDNLNTHYSVDHVPTDGVSLIVPDHSFGRGIVAKLFGWTSVLSVFFTEADKVEALLLKQAEGRWIRSRLSGSSFNSDAFNLEKEEDAIMVKMNVSGVEARRSTLNEEALKAKFGN